MFSIFFRTPRFLSLAQLAVSSAAEFRSNYKGNRVGSDNQENHEVDSAFSSNERKTEGLWIDDVEPGRRALEAHYRSAAYRELHRPAMTTSGMGLYGGEPGFEKAYRVWVDPDRPHMKNIYNQTALAKNLRYSRYGYFKRDMHILDVDKLIRHARLLPTPNRLLNDFLYQRVTLSDSSCAAFLRYQREQLECLESWRRPASLQCGEEMFERLIVTNLPPVDVGPLTHAEMIRCCAVCKEWEKGWNIYYQRAKEIESESILGEELNEELDRETEKSTDSLQTKQKLGRLRIRAALEALQKQHESKGVDNGSIFVLGTTFFDAVLELCVLCERPEEGITILEEVIQRYLRPTPGLLEKGMLLASLAVEVLDEAWLTSDNSTEKEDAGKFVEQEDRKELVEAKKRAQAVLPQWTRDHEEALFGKTSTREVRIREARAAREYYAQCGLDLWALFDFYEIPRSATTVESHMRLCAALNQPMLVMNALRFLDAASMTKPSSLSNSSSEGFYRKENNELTASETHGNDQVSDKDCITNENHASSCTLIRPTLTCFHYLLFGLRSLSDFGDFILEIFARLPSRGLQADFLLFTLAFQHCARHGDGKLAMGLYEQYWLSSGCHPTPEIVLAFLQACATCEEPTTDMLEYGERLLTQLEEIGSPHFHPAELFNAILALAAELGAVGSAFSKVKVLASYGGGVRKSSSSTNTNYSMSMMPLTSSDCYLLSTCSANSLLLANANASPPNGSAGMTEEIISLFHLLQITPNLDSLDFLDACLESFGTTDMLSAARDKWITAATAMEEARNNSNSHLPNNTAFLLSRDPDLVDKTLPAVPPHRLRRLHVRWNVSPKDIVLRRFGQHSKPPPKSQVTDSMLGSMIPFGRSPGEKPV